VPPLKRLLLAVTLLLAPAACDRLFKRSPTPDAAVALATDDAGPAVDEVEAVVDTDAGPCPRPIHPDYCSGPCKSFSQREDTRSARRISTPVRAGIGTCGKYRVFAEEQAAPDGGAGGGIVEYFEEGGGALVGATDTRLAHCGRFGAIPSCDLQIEWAPALRLSQDSPSVSGRLPLDVVVRAVRATFPRFRACYIRNVKAGQWVNGDVVLTFVVGRDGSVTSVDATSTFEDRTFGQAVSDCVADMVRHSISFLGSDGTARVRYPLVFRTM
jgi:hypothetical protein